MAYKCDECNSFMREPHDWRVLKAAVTGDQVTGIDIRLFRGEALSGDEYLVCGRKCQMAMHHRLSKQMPGSDERAHPRHGGIWEKEDDIYAALQDIFPYTGGRHKNHLRGEERKGTSREKTALARAARAV